MKKAKIIFLGLIAMIGLSACSSKTATKPSSTEATKISEKSSSSTKATTSSTQASTEDTSSSYLTLMIEAAQSQIPMLKAQIGDSIADIAIEEGPDNTVIYNYTLAQASDIAIDAEAMKPTLVKAMKPTLESLKGFVPDVKLEVNYLNPDGTNIASFTITQDDTAQVTE
ncbi:MULTISPECIES: hypothetical protein [unclassified Enterococcus]|uniref:hypothetical protein n=1 Tax=unclassified Enterococcus TaxID=2608891 RepID=UPI00155356EA|nr:MULTISPECIES: hypothetical protein [unclassified Enterococcus]MBS7578194.1 hypothetical protein [Enterococcus sp. MMGLQ5-2]MBS7585430.1 hypothetical protein [Enterococcus sp. MMGLQ5-1]NPD13287.1 hypothetical protein [Enterococcus sp. MMGLQ5-1]NPD38025.1 hypothetical protein [Enterococcus sp. MMGLQ5-2]